MKKVEIEVNDKVYNVKIACSEDDREKGLQNIPHLPENEGMIFTFEEEQEVGFWMKDTHIPLDIIFIDEDWEVISVAQGEALSEEAIVEKGVAYVLELNVNSGVSKGDYVDLNEVEEHLEEAKETESEVLTMVVLDLNGDEQMRLEGGERIFSRKNTKTLISMAKRAKKSKKDTDYKRLGTKVFAFLEKQDSSDGEYVEVPKK